MDFAITLSNFRCFSAERPATIHFMKGRQAFVGLNNIGKSALLRSIYELRRLWERGSSMDSLISLLNGESIALQGPLGTPENISNVISTYNRAAGCTITITHVDNLIMSVTVRDDQSVSCVLNGHARGPAAVWQRFATTEIRTKSPGNQNTSNPINVQPLLELFKLLRDSIYIPAIRFAGTGTTSGQRWYDIDLGTLLVQHLRALHVSEDVSHKKEYLRVERELATILNLPDLRITAVPERGQINVATLGDDFRLEEYGSGIAQFIMIAMTLVRRKPTFVLIDEPESHLHPAMQAKFLDLLSSQATMGTLFATHSMGLARLASDRAWLVQRAPGERNSYLTEVDDPSTPVELLRDLQYSAFNMVGMSKILLVEGPTEVNTIRQWLRLFGKDGQVLPLHLGGSSSINKHSQGYLNELKRLNVPIAAIIDSEKKTPESLVHADRLAFKKNCNKLGIDCLILERRKTESYLTQRAIKAAFPSHSHPAMTAYQEGDPQWGKNNNWRVAREMTKEELFDDNNDIGPFLEKI